MGVPVTNLHSGPPEECKIDALPSASLPALKTLYGGDPPGRFLRNRDGITHFCFEEPTIPPTEDERSQQRRRLAVMAHGLGTKLQAFGPQTGQETSITDELRAAGYRVLRFDYFAHGWSHAFNPWMKYGKEIMLQQVRDLLSFLLEPGEPVDLWVGHSTGGIVGPLVALSDIQQVHPIKEMALISPAFWTYKPLIARLSEKAPSAMCNLVKRLPFLKGIPAGAYIDNCKIAFAKQKGKYLYPEAIKEALAYNKHAFKLHPQVACGIMTITSFFLRDDLTRVYAAELKTLLQREDAPRTCFLWGKYDNPVPYKNAATVTSWSPKIVLVPLEGGHESTLEIQDTIAAEIVKFVKSS